MMKRAFVTSLVLASVGLIAIAGFSTKLQGDPGAKEDLKWEFRDVFLPAMSNYVETQALRRAKETIDGYEEYLAHDKVLSEVITKQFSDLSANGWEFVTVLHHSFDTHQVFLGDHIVFRRLKK